MSYWADMAEVLRETLTDLVTVPHSDKYDHAYDTVIKTAEDQDP